MSKGIASACAARAPGGASLAFLCGFLLPAIGLSPACALTDYQLITDNDQVRVDGGSGIVAGSRS